MASCKGVIPCSSLLSKSDLFLIFACIVSTVTTPSGDVGLVFLLILKGKKVFERGGWIMSFIGKTASWTEPFNEMKSLVLPNPRTFFSSSWAGGCWTIGDLWTMNLKVKSPSLLKNMIFFFHLLAGSTWILFWTESVSLFFSMLLIFEPGWWTTLVSGNDTAWEGLVISKIFKNVCAFLLTTSNVPPCSESRSTRWCIVFVEWASLSRTWQVKFILLLPSRRSAWLRMNHPGVTSSLNRSWTSLIFFEAFQVSSVDTTWSFTSSKVNLSSSLVNVPFNLVASWFAMAGTHVEIAWGNSSWDMITWNDFTWRTSFALSLQKMSMPRMRFSCSHWLWHWSQFAGTYFSPGIAMMVHPVTLMLMFMTGMGWGWCEKLGLPPYTSFSSLLIASFSLSSLMVMTHSQSLWQVLASIRGAMKVSSSKSAAAVVCCMPNVSDLDFDNFLLFDLICSPLVYESPKSWFCHPLFFHGLQGCQQPTNVYERFQNMLQVLKCLKKLLVCNNFITCLL